jgi:hypothetical protein
VEEHQLEPQVLRAPQGVIGAKSNVPVLVVAKCLQLRGRLAAYASVCPSGLQLGSRSDVVKAERSGRVTVKHNEHKAHKGQCPQCTGGGVTVRRPIEEKGLHQQGQGALSDKDNTVIGTTRFYLVRSRKEWKSLKAAAQAGLLPTDVIVFPSQIQTRGS